ncbi:hypothetical protein OPIT5_16085 [Opitutaceae bacterium TAV5]|nr:hypothetical protein OPIT5_16085 [Opitutaceae bacterium TAV5]
MKPCTFAPCLLGALVLSIPGLLRAAVSYAVDTDTLALWRFDETANPPSAYADAGGSPALQLTATGIGDLQSVPGLLGRAVTGFHPQGTTDNRRLYLDSYTQPANPSIQTFEIWVRFDDASILPHETPSGSGWANRQVLFRRAGSRQPVSFYFTDDDTGENARLCLELRDAAGVSRKLFHDLGRSIERDRWYHVAFSIRQDGSDVVARLYLQDEFGGYDAASPVAAGTFASFTYDTGVFPVSIGEAGQTGIDPFTGTIDEARLSKTERTTFATHPDFTTRFPTVHEGRIHFLGGNTRGLGMLAAAPAGGLRAVYIARATTIPAQEAIKPRPVALAQVLDPSGRVVSHADLTDSPGGSSSVVLSIPEGDAGVYTVSVIGGRSNDVFAIGLPDTVQAWGVRGELSLGFPATPAAQDYYLYLPRTWTSFKMYVYGGTTSSEIGLYAGPAYSDPVGSIGGGSSTDVWNASLSRYELTVSSALVPPSTPSQPGVIRLHIPAGFNRTLVFDGIPGLLCPDAASAIQLAGGTREAAGGILTAGPIQQRARDWMWADYQANNDYSVALTFPASVPATLADAMREALPYGQYGFLSGLQSGIANQVVSDPENPFFGANVAAGSSPPSWETFHYGSLLSTFDSLPLAAAWSVPVSANPAYGNANLLRRSILYAFYHLASMDSAHLLREGSMDSQSYPVTHAFFAYYALAQACYLLQGALPPEAGAIWKDGLVALGSKQADFQGFQSNQWGHVMLGHLYTWLATGEPRFLRWFEQQMTVYVEGGYGTNSKFGQHPAGYFLEEYGPDGNYDSMNFYVLVEAYDRYRELPGHDEALVETMRAAIEDNLTFKSFFWLPQPDGRVVGPTAMNCRVASISLAAISYPGISMARFEFPLALTRHNLSIPPATWPGQVAHQITNDTWAVQFLNWALAPSRRDNWFTGLNNPAGTWGAALDHAYRLPQTAVSAALPCESAVNRTWSNLPGLMAWKQDGLYGVVFHSVAGGKATVAGKLGGGPTCVWSPETGAIISSSQNSQSPPGAITQEAHFAHSSVFWENGGSLYSSGRKNNATGQWLVPDLLYEVTESTDADGTDRTITWTYDFTVPASPVLTVSVSPAPAGLKLNLPVYSTTADNISEVLDASQPGSFTFIAGGKTFALDWDSGAAASLESSDLTTIRRLVIPMTASPLQLTMSLYQSALQGDRYRDNGYGTGRPVSGKCPGLLTEDQTGLGFR